MALGVNDAPDGLDSKGEVLVKDGVIVFLGEVDFHACVIEAQTDDVVVVCVAPAQPLLEDLQGWGKYEGENFPLVLLFHIEASCDIEVKDHVLAAREF